GPDNGPCWFDGDGPPAPAIRAARNHPTIDEAISRVIGGDVIVGMSPEVRTCEDYSDILGHLTVESEAPIGAVIGQWYHTFDTGSAASAARMVVLRGAGYRLAVLLEADNGHKRVYVKDARSGTPISAGFAFGPYYKTSGMAAIPDFAGTRAAEIAVAGVNTNTGRVAVRILDSGSGEQINELTFSSTYLPRDIVAVRDFGGDNAWEVALLGTHVTTGRILVRIKDASSGATLSDLFFAPTHATVDLATVPDFEATAADEIALLGVRPDTGAVTVRMRDAESGDALDSLPFPQAFRPKSLVVLGDLDGGGVPEIGVLGIRDATAQVRVRFKDAVTGLKTSDVVFSERYVPETALAVTDFAGTPADEVGVLGIDDSDNVMLRIKDAEDGERLQDLPFSSQYQPLSVVTFPGIGGDTRVAVLGRHRVDGSYLIRVKSVSTGATLATIPVP
ncbi:MAG: hypothetical protein R3344_09275, partial [Acidobacteriota bacterium]|nr:hypothetical protein [Acidobacteriota bacterium]